MNHFHARRRFLLLTIISICSLLLSSSSSSHRVHAQSNVTATNETTTTSAPGTPAPTPAPGPPRPVIGGKVPFKNQRDSLRFSSDEAFYFETAASVAVATSLSFPTGNSNTTDLHIKDTLLLGTFSLKSESVKYRTVEAISNRLHEANVHVTWVLHLVSRSAWGTYVTTHLDSLSLSNVDNPGGPLGARSFSVVGLKGGEAATSGSPAPAAAAAAPPASSSNASGGGGGGLSNTELEASIFPPRSYRTLCTNIPSLRSQVVATLPGDVINNHDSMRHKLGRKLSWPLADVRGEEYAVVLTRCIWSNTIADSYADLLASGASNSQVREWTGNVFATDTISTAAAVALRFNISLPPDTIIGTSSQLASIRLRSMFLIESATGIAYIVLGVGLVFWIRVTSIKLLLIRCCGAGLVISCVGLEKEEVAAAIAAGLLVRNPDGSVSEVRHAGGGGPEVADADLLSGDDATDDASDTSSDTNSDGGGGDGGGGGRNNRHRSRSYEEESDSLADDDDEEDQQQQQQQQQRNHHRRSSSSPASRRGARGGAGGGAAASSVPAAAAAAAANSGAGEANASGTSPAVPVPTLANERRRRDRERQQSRRQQREERRRQEEEERRREEKKERKRRAREERRRRRRRRKKNSSRVAAPKFFTTSTRQPKFLFAFYYILIARGFVSVFSTFSLWSAWNGERIVALEFVAEALNALVTCVEMGALLWLATGLGTTRHYLSAREVQLSFFVLLAFLVVGGLNTVCATERAPFDVVDSLFSSPNFGVNCDTVFLSYALLQLVAGLICYVLMGNQIQIMSKALRDPMSRSAWRVRGEAKPKAGLFVEQLPDDEMTMFAAADNNIQMPQQRLQRRAFNGGGLAPPAAVSADPAARNFDDDGDVELSNISAAQAAIAINTPSGSDTSGRMMQSPAMYAQLQQRRGSADSGRKAGGKYSSTNFTSLSDDDADGDRARYEKNENGEVVRIRRGRTPLSSPSALVAAASAAAAAAASGPSGERHRRRISGGSGASGSARSANSGSAAAASAAADSSNKNKPPKHRRQGSKDSVGSAQSNTSEAILQRQLEQQRQKQKQQRREQLLHPNPYSRTPELTHLSNDDDDDDDDDDLDTFSSRNGVVMGRIASPSDDLNRRRHQLLMRQQLLQQRKKKKEKILPPLCTVDTWLRLRDFRWPFLIVALLPVLRAVGESSWKEIGGVVLLLVVERMSVLFLELLIVYYFSDGSRGT